MGNIKHRYIKFIGIQMLCIEDIHAVACLPQLAVNFMLFGHVGIADAGTSWGSVLIFHGIAEEGGII